MSILRKLSGMMAGPQTHALRSGEADPFPIEATIRDSIANAGEYKVEKGFDKVVVDVGANNGAFSHDLARAFPDATIIAIEPIPDLAARMWRAAKKMDIHNIVVVQLGVDEVCREARLNVARHADWGVSSLLKFKEDNLKNDPYWSRRSDLYHEDEITIRTVPLEAILQYFGVKSVEFLKVDTQGFDLKVVRSLKSYVKSVRGGMVEAASCDYTRLYDGGEETLLEILPELDRLGLKIYAVKPNDRGANEYNVYFHAPGQNWKALEKELDLLNNGIYGGKYYWNNPSNKL